MIVSVIIPVFNSKATIVRALEALSKQDYTSDFEVIVVDDGSKDNTADLVRTFSNIRYVYQENAGPAAARNHGARLASGEFLCFTDSDCIAHPNWISQLIKSFSDPTIGVVCGSYGIANPESLLARGIHREIIFRHTHLMPDYPKAFGSYNFCVRKDVFLGVGGFSESYRQASGEDNDLSYKIIASGNRIYFNRQALVDHRHTENMLHYLREQFRHGFWRVALYARHPGMAKGDDYTFWKDILEVPWAMLCAAGIFLSALGVGVSKEVACGIGFGFLIFEIFFGFWILKELINGIFYGTIMFLRAFARTLGLSTGIFYFLTKK